MTSTIRFRLDHGILTGRGDFVIPGLNRYGRSWSLGLEPDDAVRVLAEHADTYLERGFTQFSFGTTGPDYSLSGLEEWLKWRDERKG